MGNSASTTNVAGSSRKSTAGQRKSVSSSSSSTNAPRDSTTASQNVSVAGVSANYRNNLDEEFSDLILHQVKRDDSLKNTGATSAAASAAAAAVAAFGQPTTYMPQFQHNQFNDLIEDEFNELNSGLIETEATEISRNFLPNHDEDVVMAEDNDINDNMDVDTNTEKTPTPDLSKVDFTKIASQYPPNIQAVGGTSGANNSSRPNSNNADNKFIPVEIKWVNVTKESIHKISIIGSFSNWRDVLKLVPSPFHENEFITTLSLPLGVHKLLYIINNEYRVSDMLPTATDQEGIFFNWFEVIDDTHLFNHSSNQPNHLNASTDYDANIISSDFHHTFHSSTSIHKQQQQQQFLAGKHEVEKINRKSNGFLAKLSKETFEHVEFPDEHTEHTEHVEQQHQENQQNMIMDNQSEMQSENQTNENDNLPQGQANYPYISDANSSTKYVPYNYSTSSSFQRAHNSQTKKYTYSKDIPDMFVNYDYFKSKGDDYELPEPPQLPAHLNNVLLNKISQPSSNSTNPHMSHIPHTFNGDFRPPNPGFIEPSATPGGSAPSHRRPPLRRADSSYYASNKEAYHLSVPNHVILNHLMTTSIRNDVLTVACITRYSGKFVTQIMHSPAE